MPPRIPLRAITTRLASIRRIVTTPSLCNRECSTLPLYPTVRFMPTTRSAAQFGEPPFKRRRTSYSTATPAPQPTMAVETDATPPALPIIELTRIENTLRHLLLDVVEYIQQKELKNGEEAAAADLVLRFTGGWVRDKLLGVESHDIDVGISTMTGYKFGLEMKEYLDIPEHLEKYKNFHSDDALRSVIGGLHKIEANPEKSKHLETVATKIFGLEVDLVNLRRETYSDHSRHPEMEFGTAQEDAMRRDATVNALFYNLHTASVEDFTGRGIADLNKQLIRTPLEPYQTFKDDPLRVLRLIRFSSRLSYHIDPRTEEAMQHDDIKYALKLKISQERIGAEVEKMMKGPDPFRALCIIDRLGLYETIFANHQDDASVNVSSWNRAYRSLMAILDDHYTEIDASKGDRTFLRKTLTRNKTDRYHAWIVAAFSPWAVVPYRDNPNNKKGLQSRASAVARESLRAENKITSILNATVRHHETVSKLKSAFLQRELAKTVPEIRLRLGQAIRTMGLKWRLCFLQAILLEIMQGAEAKKVFQEYAQFLLYLGELDLLEVELLRPLANGHQLAAAFGVKPGPWMTRALEIVIDWQLRNPERVDGQGAIDEVMKHKDELDFTAVNKVAKEKEEEMGS